jgi:hypothetical protein
MEKSRTAPQHYPQELWGIEMYVISNILKLLRA